MGVYFTLNFWPQVAYYADKWPKFFSNLALTTAKIDFVHLYPFNNLCNRLSYLHHPSPWIIRSIGGSGKGREEKAGRTQKGESREGEEWEEVERG